MTLLGVLPHLSWSVAYAFRGGSFLTKVIPQEIRAAMNTATMG
jgi:hypothetical protein